MCYSRISTRVSMQADMLKKWNKISRQAHYVASTSPDQSPPLCGQWLAYLKAGQLTGTFEYSETGSEEWTDWRGEGGGGTVRGRCTSLSRLSLSLSAGSGWKSLHRQRRKHVMRGDDTATETYSHPHCLLGFLLAAVSAATVNLPASHREEREERESMR